MPTLLTLLLRIIGLFRLSIFAVAFFVCSFAVFILIGVVGSDSSDGGGNISVGVFVVGGDVPFLPVAGWYSLPSHFGLVAPNWHSSASGSARTRLLRTDH